MGDVAREPTRATTQLRTGLLALAILLVVMLSSWGISHLWRGLQDRAQVREQAVATRALSGLAAPPGFVPVVGSECPPVATICWHADVATDEAASKLSAYFGLSKSQVGVDPDPMGGAASYILGFNLQGAEVVAALVPSYATTTRRGGSNPGTNVSLAPRR